MITILKLASAFPTWVDGGFRKGDIQISCPLDCIQDAGSIQTALQTFSNNYIPVGRQHLYYLQILGEMRCLPGPLTLPVKICLPIRTTTVRVDVDVAAVFVPIEGVTDDCATSDLCTVKVIGMSFEVGIVVYNPISSGVPISVVLE